MRLSAGGCYEITGTALRRVTDGAAVGDTTASWEQRHADLVGESLAIAHVQHTLTAEENGLWNAIQRELEAVDAAIAERKRNGG